MHSATELNHADKWRTYTPSSQFSIRVEILLLFLSLCLFFFLLTKKRNEVLHMNRNLYCVRLVLENYLFENRKAHYSTLCYLRLCRLHWLLFEYDGAE